MSIRAPKSNNRMPLKTGGLTSQTSAVVDKKSLFSSSTTSTTVNQMPIVGKQLTQQINDNTPKEKSSKFTEVSKPAAVSSSKNDLSKLSSPGINVNIPNVPPNVAFQEKVIYNGDPTYYEVKLRPEVLLLSQFKPLYNTNSNELTKEGELFELNVSNLRNIESNANNFLKQTIGEAGIEENNARFKSQISVLRDNLKSLDSFIKKIETYKQSLDIAKDKRYKFVPGTFVSTNLSSIESVINNIYGSSEGSSHLYDLKQALIESRSISNDNEIKSVNYFSSSKLFLISVNELKSMIQTHSYGRLKNKVNSLSSSTSDEINQNLEKYSLISGDKILGGRVSVSSFTNGITKFSDLSSTGDDRFNKIQNILSTNFSSVEDEIGIIFHLCFKDLIQKIRFEVNKKDSSITNRNDVLNSFIGYYPQSSNKSYVYDEAISKANGFTGEKLSDLVFFRNLNDLQQRVLILEDYSSNNFPTTVSTGEDYLFSGGNAEKFLTNQIYELNKIKDFKDFLDKISNDSFENLINLGPVPFDDDTALSLGKGFVSLNPVKAFIQIMNGLVKTKTLSNGNTVAEFKLSIIPEINPQNKNLIKSANVLGDNNFNNAVTDNDIIALFCYSPDKQKEKFYNCLYSYVYHLAIGGDSSEPDFVKKVAESIIDVLLENGSSNSSAEGIQFETTQNPVLKSVYGQRLMWVDIISKSLIDSKFVKKIVTFFKQFLNFEELLPTFFLSILKIIQKVSSVRIYQLSTDPGLYLKFTTAYYFSENNYDISLFSYKTTSIISEEMTKIFNLMFAILNSIKTLNKNISSTLNDLQDFDKSITDYLLAYLNNDKKKLSILFQQPQLLLLLSTVEDLYQSYNGFSVEDADKSKLFVKKQENLPHSTKIVELLRSYFSDAEFLSNKGYNKQIISVGISQGLLKSLNNVLKNKKSINAKQDDIFRISIYKMDLLNPYIIYKPQQFLFEASRFVDRVYSDIKNVKDIKISNSIPTRNYSLFSDASLAKPANPYFGTDLSNAFGEEYKFLTDDEKNEILENHTVSFLLENYLRLFSGLNLNELTFNLTSPDEIESIYSSLLGKGSTEAKLKKAISNAIPNPDPYISKLIQPKRFDRVFNIIFDPDKFVINYDAMLKNFSNEDDGLKSSVRALLDDPQRYKTITQGKTYIDLDKNPQDISLNTYFVSIETHAKVIK